MKHTPRHSALRKTVTSFQFVPAREFRVTTRATAVVCSSRHSLTHSAEKTTAQARRAGGCYQDRSFEREERVRMLFQRRVSHAVCSKISAFSGLNSLARWNDGRQIDARARALFPSCSPPVRIRRRSEYHKVARDAFYLRLPHTLLHQQRFLLPTFDLFQQASSATACSQIRFEKQGTRRQLCSDFTASRVGYGVDAAAGGVPSMHRAPEHGVVWA